MNAYGIFSKGGDVSKFETAQICRNGHMVTSSVETSPELGSKFCAQCGVETITTCMSCNAKIRGHYYVEGVVSLMETPVPGFCHECGSAYPWTEAKLTAAKDLTDELDELNEDEKTKLKGTLDDLVRDTPQTEVAAIRFKKVMAKVGGSAASAMRDIIVDVVSETAKKALFGE